MTAPPSYLAGYESGRAGVVDELARTPAERDAYNVGYAIGARDRRADELIAELSKRRHPPT